MTPDRREDSNAEQSAEALADAEPKQRTTPVEPLDEPLLPDSYRMHHPPTAPPAPTMHKTIETATVKIKDEEEDARETEDEMRRRVTVRRKRASTPGSSNAPVTLPEEDRQALEDQLVLRKATAGSKHWLVLVGAAGVLALILLVMFVRSGSRTEEPVAIPVAPATNAVETPAQPIVPPPPEPAPTPEATAEAPDPAVVEPTPATAALPKPKAAAAAKPVAEKPAAKPTEEPKPAAKSPGEPPKASFPPTGATADIRRDVPF